MGLFDFITRGKPHEMDTAERDKWLESAERSADGGVEEKAPVKVILREDE